MMRWLCRTPSTTFLSTTSVPTTASQPPVTADDAVAVQDPVHHLPVHHVRAHNRLVDGVGILLPLANRHCLPVVVEDVLRCPNPHDGWLASDGWVVPCLAPGKLSGGLDGEGVRDAEHLWLA